MNYQRQFGPFNLSWDFANESSAKSSANRITTGIDFMDYLLGYFAKYGDFGLEVQFVEKQSKSSVISIDYLGHGLGKILYQHLSKSKRISAFSYGLCDDSLSRVVIDASEKRPSMLFDTSDYLHGDLLAIFFESFVNQAQISLHIQRITGTNRYQQLQSLFKALGLVTREIV